MKNFFFFFSNFEGFYEIRVNSPVDSIHVSCLGYNAKTKPVKRGIDQVVNFQLSPSVHTLQEIVIVPGENPAFKILRKMEEFKPKNDPKQFSAYQFENYNRVQIGIDNMSDKFKNRKIFKFRGILQIFNKHRQIYIFPIKHHKFKFCKILYNKQKINFNKNTNKKILSTIRCSYIRLYCKNIARLLH